MGSRELPPQLQECVDSWKRLMPDYEIIRWDESRVKDIESIFVKEAIEMKKWAFASDYVRLHALYHEGGIYFDTDVMVFKSFDEFLSLPAFIGAENVVNVSRMYTPRCLTSFCMGSEAGNLFLKAALDYYKDRHFIRSRQEWLPESLRLENTVNSFILMEIAKTFGYDPSPRGRFPQILSNGMKVFHPDYFSAAVTNRRSYAEHRAAGSWRQLKFGEPGTSLPAKIKSRLRIRFLQLVDKLGFVLLKKK